MNQHNLFKLIFSLLTLITVLAFVMVILTGCSKSFDGFDPTTTTLKWIIQHDKR